MSRPRFCVIDGSAIICQSYYALGWMRTSTGVPMGAVFGFYTRLQKIVRTFGPEHIVVCLDRGRNTFRKLLYHGYKAHRGKTPSDLATQFPLVRELLRCLNIVYIDSINYEADDYIASISLKMKESCDVLVYSPDKDLCQVLTDGVYIIKYVNQDFQVVTPETFKNKYNIYPHQMVDYLALVGDTSDNVPGAKGIGKKTATNLLACFKSVDNIYNNLPLVLIQSVKKKLEASKYNVLLSKKLVQLRYDLDVDFITMESCRYPAYNMDKQKLNEFLARMEIDY